MPEKIGQYTVVSQIGRGGMGIVFKARDESLNRFVAIKVLSEQLTEDTIVRQRFVREAQAAAGLSHPNIVQIFFIGEDNGQPYFGMEYVSGRSLDQLLRSEGQIDNPRASQLILQAAHGLAAAHDKGIIHRDIKPANLILDERGQLKIADFGLALPADAQTQLTATGMFVGTPGYLAPEQCAGEKVDNRTDIYALGVSFYQLLTGTPPFRGESPLALVKQIMDSEPADVSTLNPKVDATTRRILGRMMAKDRAARYQNCHELVADLEESLATQGVRSMTAGLAMPAPLSTAERAAVAAAATQVIDPHANLKPTTQPAAPVVQYTPPPTAGEPPVASPPTMPNPVPAPRRSGSRTALMVALLAVVLLVGGGIAAVVVGTKVFRNYQSRWQQKNPDAASQQAVANTTTASPATKPAEGVLLSEAVKMREVTDTKDPAYLPPPATAGQDSPSSQPEVTPAGGTAIAKGSAAGGGAATPARVRTDRTSPASRQNAAPEGNRPAAETSRRTRTGVAVAATGDPALSGAVSSVVRSELEAAGLAVVDAQSLPATEDLLRGGDVSAARLIDRLGREGYAVLLLARIDPTGQRELSYYGRHDTLYTSRVTLTAYDLTTGRPFGSSGSASIDYTSINIDSKSEAAVGPLARSAARAIQSH
ncbi:MAG TPA: protein kinase [Thermoanaerobaculia bacterium]|nr:protein kinase [Thermoanaerobaculia bacterium]